MSKRKSFIIHHDSLDVIDKLTDEQAGKLLKAIKAYQLEEDYDIDVMTDLVFTPFKAQFKRDNEKYQKIVERNKNNGLKGGRPQTQVNPEEPKKPSGLTGNPEEPKKADSKSDSKSKSGSDSKSKSGSKRFVPPSIEEVFNHLTEKGYPYKIEAEKFWNYYESNGWKVGKNKMKNWKSAATGWIQRANLPKKQQPAQIPPENHDPLAALRDL